MSRVLEGRERVQAFLRADAVERVRAANLWTCQDCGAENTNRYDPCECTNKEDTDA
jgi:hypothetical protein